jgi:hypothetical protein
VAVLERKNAGTVKVQAEHGEQLKAKGNGKNVPSVEEMGLIAVLTVMEQEEFE